MKKLGYILFSMIIMMMCWETSLEAKSMIPEDAIRLRILANSDLPQDQWIKRQVRDAIILEMNGWVEALAVTDQATARTVLQTKLSAIEEVIARTLKQAGFEYGYQVELGLVPFPTKVYGNQVYPAGEYEALRITLGKGEGQNWWCVLFPPLCFVDITTDEYTLTEDSQQLNNREQPIETNSSKESKKIEKGKKPKVEASFFIVDLWKTWF